MPKIPRTIAFKLDTATIGRRIKERRLERGETQQAIGKACGLSQNSMMKIEKGATQNSRFVTKIWAYLGLNLVELSDLYRSEAQPANNDQIEVSVLRKTHLIKAIKYEIVRLEGVGGKTILITCIAKNGTIFAGAMDRSMIVEAVAEFHRYAQALQHE
jgi:transcriptional regulator with XRE-family HTH domain